MERLGFDLILIGAPASGKDTQAGLLMEKFKLRPVESGKHWRKLAAQKNDIGLMLQKTFSKGNPTPVKLMKEFLVSELKKVKADQDLIFIGNPRLKPEAQLLNKLLLSKQRDYFVISLDLPVPEIKARSLKRLRDDQDWKYVDNRIKMYKVQVRKTVLYFKSLGKLKVIDGNQPIPKVFKDILKAIHDYQRSHTNRTSKGKRQDSR